MKTRKIRIRYSFYCLALFYLILYKDANISEGKHAMLGSGTYKFTKVLVVDTPYGDYCSKTLLFQQGFRVNDLLYNFLNNKILEIYHFYKNLFF